jgi:hypothetical protein
LLWIAALLFGVGALSAGTAASPSITTDNVRIAIELRASTLVAPGQTETMIAEADALWRPNGVSVVLSSPTALQPAVVRLTVALEPGGGRKVTFCPGARRSTNDSQGLGSIWFDEEGVRRDVIFVNVDAVVATIKQAGAYGRSVDSWPPALFEKVTARAAGRVLAHEIGHFLLAWPAHSGKGLMRASFNGRELAGSDRRSFTLDRTLLPRLRVLLAR